MRTLDMIKRNLLATKNVVITFAAIPAGAGLFGMILGLIIDYFTHEMDCLEFAAIFAAMGGAFSLIFGAVIEERESFTDAVTMGVSRKAYIPARFITLLIQIALTWLIIFVMYLLEKGVCSLVYPGAELINPIIEMGIPVLPCIVFSLTFPVFAMLFGILYVKYEKKFFWVLWAFWMILCLGGPRVGNAMSERPDSLVGRMGNAIFNSTWLDSTKVSIIVVALAVVSGFITYKLYKKQDITV